MEQRTSRETKELIEQAARLQGVNASEFVLAHATVAARETLDRFAVTKVREADIEAFIRAFEDTEPNEALVDLMSLPGRIAEDG
jgi:uncharacterized protein (DUF1778 family)